MIVLNLREEFEADMLQSGFKAESFLKDEKGGYKSPKVRSMWKGYQLYHKRKAQETIALEQRENSVGTYVIVKISHVGVPLFSKSPYRHTSRTKAQIHLKEMVTRYGDVFGLYRCIEISGPLKDHTCVHCGHVWQHEIGFFCPECKKYQTTKKN